MMEGLAVAIGTFDGVHCGHRALLGEVVDVSRRSGLLPGVVTFRNHPLSLLRPERVPTTLATPLLKEQLLRRAGMERIINLDFTAELARLSAAEFIAWLHREHGVRHIVVGFNTSMGSDRVTSIDRFCEIGRDCGVTVTRAAEFSIPGIDAAVCSSTIRRMIAEGAMESTARLLGRRYSLTGSVVHGKALGRSIGFPTANLNLEPTNQTLPKPGVYACSALTTDGETYAAMVNIGCRPTVDGEGSATTIEAHLLDFSGDMYGRRMTLEFASRLRDEMKFESVEALAGQLERDARNTREII